MESNVCFRVYGQQWNQFKAICYYYESRILFIKRDTGDCQTQPTGHIWTFLLNILCSIKNTHWVDWVLTTNGLWAQNPIHVVLYKKYQQSSAQFYTCHKSSVGATCAKCLHVGIIRWIFHTFCYEQLNVFNGVLQIKTNYSVWFIRHPMTRKLVLCQANLPTPTHTIIVPTFVTKSWLQGSFGSCAQRMRDDVRL